MSNTKKSVIVTHDRNGVTRWIDKNGMPRATNSAWRTENIDSIETIRREADEVTCPECGGTGVIEHEVGLTFNGSQRWSESTCPLCDGALVVDTITAREWREKNLRKAQPRHEWKEAV